MNVKKAIRTTEAVLTLTAMGLGVLIYDQAQTSKQEKLELELQQLRAVVVENEERQLRFHLHNLIGDCTNENVLRESLDIPLVDFETCVKERAEWFNQMQREPSMKNEVQQ